MFKKKFLYISVVLLFMIATLVPSSHVFGQEETQEPCEGRRASGDGSMIPFCAGEEVFGVDIYLSTGESCEGGNCWLPSAPVSGEVRTGVVNPWDGEVPGGIEPWNPYPPTETPIPTSTPTETPIPTQTPPEPTPTETGECQNPQGNHETHPPDGNAWSPQGSWRTVRLWIPGDPTYGSDHKLFLEPNDNVGIVNGAGSSWSWNVGCGDIAWENYQAIGDPEVTLQELRDAGLIEEGEPPIETPTPTPTATATTTPPTPTSTPEEPVVCNNPDQPEPHTPIRGQYWQIGPYNGWTIVELWTNEPGHDQGLRTYWLQPDETLYFLGGGTLWIWPQGCRDVAWENFQANPLPKVTYDELASEGLILLPEEETLEVVNQEVTLFTPLDFIEPGTIMPEPLTSETTMIVEDSPNGVYQAVQNGGNLTIKHPDGTEYDLGMKCSQVEWNKEDWTILCLTTEGELVLTDRLKTFERDIVDNVSSIEDISPDGEWITYTDSDGETWVVSIHGWHFGHASPDAWWVASAFSP